MKLLISSLSCIVLQIKQVSLVTVFSEGNLNMNLKGISVDSSVSAGADCIRTSTRTTVEGGSREGTAGRNRGEGWRRRPRGDRRPC